MLKPTFWQLSADCNGDIVNSIAILRGLGAIEISTMTVLQGLDMVAGCGNHCFIV
jgi:hypothetical protein